MREVSGKRLWERPKRLWVWLMATLVSTLVLTTLIGAFQDGAISSVGYERPAGLVLVGLIGLVLVVAAEWTVGARHPHASIGLAVVAVGVTIPLWSIWSGAPDSLRSNLLAVAPLAVAGASQVTMMWSPESRDRTPLVWVYALSLAACVVHLVGYNPFNDQGCSLLCIDVPALAGDAITTRAVVAWVGILTLGASTVAIVRLVVSKRRIAPFVVMLGALSAIVLMTIPWMDRWARWPQRPPEVILLLPLFGATLLGAATLAAALQSAHTRKGIARTVGLLNQAEAVLRDAESPIDGLQFSMPDNGRWIDLSGSPVAQEPGVDYLVVTDSSGPVLRIPVERNRDPADVLDALTPAARLAVKNAQLAAMTRARISEVRASQARVVAAYDAERFRIERDLHDGAQQRLVSAALYLSHARGLVDDPHPVLDQAEGPLREALSGLRRLAHGVIPESIQTGGLGAALQQLADDSSVPVIIDFAGDISVPPDVARAVYVTAAAVVEGSSKTVSVLVRQDGVLDVTMQTELAGTFGDSPDLTEARDRVGSLGGDIFVSANEVNLRLPCE